MKKHLLGAVLLASIEGATANDADDQRFYREMISADQSTYCFGGFYSRSYSFSSNYAYHCGFNKKRTYLKGKDLREVKESLATQGLHYVKSDGSIDIYKLGPVAAEDTQIQLFLRYMRGVKDTKRFEEFLTLKTGRYVVNYRAQERSLSDFTRVREGLREFNYRHVGVLLYGSYGTGTVLQDIGGVAFLIVPSGSAAR